MINLETKHIDIGIIKQKIEIIFEDILNVDSDPEKYRNNIINKIIENLYEFLQLNNKEDKIFLKGIIESISDKNADNEFFKEYMLAVLDNYIDFSNISENYRKTIHNYIVDFMEEKMQNKKHDLNKMCQKNYVIKYINFNEDIVLKNKEEKIFMVNDAIEYLLYLMKKSLVDENNNNSSMNDLDLRVFLNYYNEKKI